MTKPFMSFGNGIERPEGEYPLPAGSHEVKLASLKYVASTGKVVAEFKAADGLGYYTEWLGMNSDGQMKRLGAFTGHLAEICGVPRPSVFGDPSDFNHFGQSLVAADASIMLRLRDDSYEGKVKQVIDGKFDEAMVAVVPF